MLTKEYIEEHALSPTEYYDSIQEKYRDRWDKKLDKAELSEDQMSFLKSDKYLPIKIVAISAEWCPDCQNAIPLVFEFAEQSEFIELYLLERDDHKEVLQDYKTNGGMRVPLVLFMNEEFQEIARWVERSTLTYSYLLEAKKKALEVETDDYSQFLRQYYKENSDQMFAANLEELFAILKKSIIIRTSGAELDELNRMVVA